jgi:hypothetical protein
METLAVRAAVADEATLRGGAAEHLRDGIAGRGGDLGGKTLVQQRLDCGPMVPQDLLE